MNIEGNIYFRICVFVSFRYTLRSEIAESRRSSYLNFLRKLPTVFHSGYTHLQSNQQCTRVCFLSLPCQHFLVFDFFMMAILTGMRLSLIVVLIFISLMISDLENCFTWLLVICMFPWEKCVCSGPLPPFFIILPYFISFLLFIYFFLFWPSLQHMDSPRPSMEFEPELQPTPQLQQCWLLNPLCRAMGPTRTSTETSQIINPLCHSRNSSLPIF